jgi:hypothetical protein
MQVEFHVQTLENGADTSTDAFFANYPIAILQTPLYIGG